MPISFEIMLPEKEELTTKNDEGMTDYLGGKYKIDVEKKDEFNEELSDRLKIMEGVDKLKIFDRKADELNAKVKIITDSVVNAANVTMPKKIRQKKLLKGKFGKKKESKLETKIKELRNMRSKAVTNDAKKDCMELEAILQAERLQIKAKRKKDGYSKNYKRIKTK